MAEAAAEVKATAKKFELMSAKYTRREKGDVVRYTKGDVIALSDSELIAFGDMFKPVTEQKAETAKPKILVPNPTRATTGAPA